jgi:predicted acyl esterase
MLSPAIRTLALCCSAVLVTSAMAAESQVSRPGEYSGYTSARYDGYKLTSQYVAMRDGTRLAVDVILPTLNGAVASGKFPVVWMHTPYNRRNQNDGLTAANYPGKALQLVKYGYIVAVADFRGTYASFGHNAGYNRGEWQDFARWDAYDITEWLAKQPWSNGKIGMWGCSATGGSQMQALTTAPPSLKAVFPMSCEWDVYPFVATGGITPPPGQPTQILRGLSRAERDAAAVPVDGDDDRKLLKAAIEEHANNLESAGFVPFRDSTSDTFGNQWWLKSSPYMYADVINKSKVAIYTAANLEEGHVGYGPPFTFNNVRTPKKLILGPATHCDWTTVLKKTGFDIVVEELRFFDYWLRDIDNGIMREPAVTYYTFNEDPARAWQYSPVWPLANEKRTEFYLGDGTLSTSPAQSTADTKMQVNYEVTNDNFWDTGMSFTTAPLTTDTQVTGYSVATLWISTTATDADVNARIDDVAPDGTHHYVGIEGKLRASLRATQEAPYNNMGLPWHPFTQESVQKLEPGVPVEVQFNFMPTSYVFKAGHRIRLTLQFADARATPRVEPAPTVTVLHRAGAASRLELPLIPR